MNRTDQITKQIDALAALREEKARVLSQLRKSGRNINTVSQRIFEPVPATSNRILGLTHLVSNGLAIYEGLRMGTGFVRAARAFFRRRR
jgi:hypothetical protein